VFYHRGADRRREYTTPRHRRVRRGRAGQSSIGQRQAKCATTALTPGRPAVGAVYSGTG